MELSAGQLTLSGSGQDLLANPLAQSAYLGMQCALAAWFDSMRPIEWHCENVSMATPTSKNGQPS